MVIASKMKVLDPIGDMAVFDIEPAPRLETLDGKVIGLYNNGKLNAAKLLDMVEAVLAERHDVKEFVRGKYNAGKSIAATTGRISSAATPSSSPTATEGPALRAVCSTRRS